MSGGELRQRHVSDTAEDTTPSKADGIPLPEDTTPIPIARKEVLYSGSSDAFLMETTATTPASSSHSPKALTGEQVKKQELKLNKIGIRVILGVFLWCIFSGSVRQWCFGFLLPNEILLTFN